MDAYTSMRLGEAAAELSAGWGVAWLLVAGVFVLVFLVHSGVLVYHWYAYSMNKTVVTMALALYATISLVFIIAMVSSALALS